MSRRLGPADKHDATSAQRHPQQNMHEATRNAQKRERAAGNADDPSSGVFRNLRDISVSPCQTIKWSWGETFTFQMPEISSP